VIDPGPGADPADALAEAEQIAIPVMRPPLRPRPTPSQARRIDRLSRAAHRFHRHAHHPLCDRYAGEVLRIRWRGRRLYLCRGCSFAAIGGVIGGAVGLSAPDVSLVALIAGTALLVPTIASKWRLSKLISRWIPAALFALALVGSLRAQRWVVAAIVMLVVGGLRWLYGKRGGDRTPCVTCPERDASPCSGFVQIVRREQAFQRLARRWLG